MERGVAGILHVERARCFSVVTSKATESPRAQTHRAERSMSVWYNNKHSDVMKNVKSKCCRTDAHHGDVDPSSSFHLSPWIEIEASLCSGQAVVRVDTSKRAQRSSVDNP